MIYCAGEECMGPRTTAASLQDAAVQWNTRAASQPDREAILTTLQQHHDWHLQAGTIGLQDGEGGWIAIDNGAEYSDSALYERTAKLLEGAPEELQPIPRGGMNTWWWEQAVLLRRKLRALEKAQEAPAVGPDVREALETIASNDGNADQAVAKRALELIDNLSALTRPLGGFVQGSIADGGQCNEQSAPQPSPALRAYQALFEPPESDAYDNLTGALHDIKRHIEAGKPTDDVCVRTIERVLDQINAAYTALRSEMRQKSVAETDADAQRGDGLVSGGEA